VVWCVGVVEVGLRGVELQHEVVPDVLRAQGAGLHADHLHVDGPDQLGVQIGVAELPGEGLPDRQSLINSGLPFCLLLAYLCNQLADGVVHLVALCLGGEGEVDAVMPAVEVEPVFEEEAVSGGLDVAVLVELDADELLVGQLAVDQDGQVREEVDHHRGLETDGVVLGDVVPGLGLDDVSELEVQIHHRLVLLLVLHRQVVLLVDLVVQVDRLLQVRFVGVPLLCLRPVVPQDEVVFEGPLEGLADEIVEGDDAAGGREGLFDSACFVMFGEEGLEFVLCFCEIFEEVGVEDEEAGVLDHGESDDGGPALPVVEQFLELLVDLGREIDHAVDVGEHPFSLLAGYQPRSLQFLHYAVADGD
jgi:hypothetical protein